MVAHIPLADLSSSIQTLTGWGPVLPVFCELLRKIHIFHDTGIYLGFDWFLCHFPVERWEVEEKNQDLVLEFFSC